jgi:hypothetical protein
LRGTSRSYLLPNESILWVTLGSLLLDALFVAGGWVTGSPIRVAVILLSIDVVLLGLWVLGIPIRRWLARSPY